ncbi:hypothetical protein CEUSTIGMA_g9631.t1 [Chlamydomonas eustigma]|uniref:Cilia- and flagella-associated protein 69 ARM repeats domain-containing protein n=1 Tax=Chlamydomonas eustigma TaxID=1157962 RepID=A0A250XGM1_9CHLO|nr:hypothetical protein CEUSTIGMA_g9631.t1 [Chlamydomonas eustigma]|eukprot:GAX82203.1 hypothetical protein CEUSTIGMA_g9631.t1 [Chlamydomonas eustigma]
MNMPGPEIDKLIKLFTDGNSSELYDRHCASIERLCANSTEGFAIQDLPKIQQILELTFGLILKGIEGLNYPACKLLRSMSMPFLHRASTDEINLLGNVERILSAIGKAFSSGFPRDVQMAAAEMLRVFSSANSSRPSALEIASVSLDTANVGSSVRQFLLNQRLIQQSHVIRAIINGLKIALQDSDEVLAISLMSTLLSISYLPANCQHIVESGILSCTPSLLSFGFKHELTSVTVEVLWNLLEHDQEIGKHLIMDSSLGTYEVAVDVTLKEKEVASNERSHHSLTYALTSLFKSVLELGSREVDKELRNNTLVVINLMLFRSSQLAGAFASAGLFEASLAVSCAPECCNGMPYVKPWALSTEELDFELKLLCWSLSAAGCVSQPSLFSSAKTAGLMPTLMQYLDYSSLTPAVQRWNADRSSSLRCSALSLLYKLAPVFPEEYLAVGGISVLLNFLRSSTNTSHVESGLRHLHALSIATPAVAENLGEQGAIPLVLDLAKPGTGLQDKLRQTSLQLLSVMCESALENQRRLRKVQGVAVLLSLLSEACTLDPTLPSSLVLATLNAIWNCIVPDKKNLAHFLVSDGLDLLLNLIEKGHRSHMPLALSLMADMLQNPRALPFFHQWRSELNQQTAGHLLITFWKEEDGLRGMTVNGILANTSQPLRGLDKRTAWIAHESVVYGNLSPERRAELTAIIEACTGENILAKIFSVFKLVGMGTLNYLSLEDQAMLCLIEKYVKFSQGDLWRKIKSEFEDEGMRPTAADRERLAAGIELCEHLAQAVRDAQHSVLDRHVGSLKDQEKKFFEGMQAQRKLEQDMRFYQKDKSQLTLAEIREAKQKKEQMLKNSHNLSHFTEEVDQSIVS